MTNIVSIWQPEAAKITLTAAAIKHLEKQIKKQGHGIGMRFGVKKSGCSGFAYQVDLIDESAVDDKIFQVSDHLIIAVSTQHMPFLQGTEIDFIQEGVNQRFHFKNPNETASCGCGESFSVEDL